jgi:hypothetical protein
VDQVKKPDGIENFSKSKSLNNQPSDPVADSFVLKDPNVSDPSKFTEPEALERLITYKIISGSCHSVHVSSEQTFNTCLSITNIRTQFPDVYEPGLFGFLLIIT